MQIPLKATPEIATTHVCMTVFSCRVNGCLTKPNLLTTFVHALIMKYPSKPAARLREGIIPVDKFRFITTKLKKTPNMRLTTNALTVICSLHEGTFIPSNSISIVGLPRSPLDVTVSMTDTDTDSSRPSISFSLSVFQDYQREMRVDFFLGIWIPRRRG